MRDVWISEGAVAYSPLIDTSAAFSGRWLEEIKRNQPDIVSVGFDSESYHVTQNVFLQFVFFANEADPAQGAMRNAVFDRQCPICPVRIGVKDGAFLLGVRPLQCSTPSVPDSFDFEAWTDQIVYTVIEAELTEWSFAREKGKK